ncbi:MAG: ribosome maturation protein RimP [Pseudomonadota bacterium]
MADIAELTKLIEPEVQALGFELVRVKFIGADEEFSLQIMAERPETGQLVIEDCADLSRRVSDKFDALEEAGEDPIGVPYRLEISSPGIDRPLTRLADFDKWAGHEARVRVIAPVQGRKQMKGVLVGLVDDEIAVNDHKFGRLSTPFENVDNAKLLLTDALIAATAPLDISDAEIETETETDTEEQED